MRERFLTEYNGETCDVNTGLRENYRIWEWDSDTYAYVYCGQVWINKSEWPVSAYHAEREKSENEYC